jgi:anaerobic selenocysteine-containing dehydrogenase
MRKISDTTVFQSVCQECYMGDGVLVYVKNGKVVKIKDLPDENQFWLSAKHRSPAKKFGARRKN